MNLFSRFGRSSMNLERLARLVLPNPPPGRFFTETERRTVMALAEVLLDGAPIKIPVEDVADNVEAFLLRGKSRRAWRVRLLYNVVELAPVLLLKQKPFSKQTFAERQALANEKFKGGRYIWGICGKARHLIYLGAYADSRAARQLGFVPILERPRYVHLRSASLEQARGIRNAN